MKFHVIFKQPNSEFNQEYANTYHFGSESDGNLKDNWSREFLINEVVSYRVLDNEELAISGHDSNGIQGEVRFPRMTILETTTGQGKVHSVAAVSKCLLERTHMVKSENNDTVRFYFYLKDSDEFVSVGDTIYVAVSDVPEE